MEWPESSKYTIYSIVALIILINLQFRDQNHRYGLIKPHKPNTRLLAFASDSDSDNEPSKKRISIGESATQKRQARIIHEDALKEDPSIFQYDEIYDKMSATREEAKKAKSNVKRESKYISRLLVTAEKRKIEFETRIERKVQKEREAEGDEFKDKEVFVTAAYRQKLEAMKKAEEEAQREEYLECIGDVQKQKDLSGFYRHMYEQKLGKDKPETKVTEKDEPVAEIKMKDEKSIKRRTYRKHSDHENSEEEEQSTSTALKTDVESKSKKVHLQSNLDADSDFSIDSSDSEDENETKKKQKENENGGDKKETSGLPSVEKSNNSETSDESKEEKGKVEAVDNEVTKKDENNIEKPNKEKISDEERMPPPKEVKPKIDIWKKRTVGDVYLAAVKRYFERKDTAA